MTFAQMESVSFVSRLFIIELKMASLEESFCLCAELAASAVHQARHSL